MEGERMTQLVAQSNGVARAPKVLAPLIEEQVSLGYRAGESFFMRAGMLLLEARQSIRSTVDWSRYLAKLRVDGSERGVAADSANQWMRLARSEQLGLGHVSVKAAAQDPRTRTR